MSTIPATSTTRTAASGAAKAGRLHLIRGVVALIWAGLLIAALSGAGSLTPQQTIPAFAIALLIIYPLIDLLATLVDARSVRNGAPRSAAAQWINAVISAVAVAAIAATASHGADAVFRVFGTWALLTGLIQLTLAVLRRRRRTAGQLPMILSGSISSVAGIGFILMAATRELNLMNLAFYAVAGAAFFFVSAWRMTSRRHAKVDRTVSA